MLEGRHVEPLAKEVAAMFYFKVLMGRRYITLCEDRTKGARKMCLDMNHCNETLMLTLPTKSADHSVAYCHLGEGVLMISQLRGDLDCLP